MSKFNWVKFLKFIKFWKRIKEWKGFTDLNIKWIVERKRFNKLN